MEGDPAPTSSEDPPAPELLEKWAEVQVSLRRQLIMEDRFGWKLPMSDSRIYEGQQHDSCEECLKYVGGVDLSFSKSGPSFACASLVVLDFATLDVLYEDSVVVKLSVPYIPGFLAFREAPVILELLQKMKRMASPCYPQVLMVDGNGLLHPRGFGLACHVGVLADLPTIGIGKNLHHVDGLTQSRVKQLLAADRNSSTDIFPLVGNSGSTLGAAMKPTKDSKKPVFISVGHSISLASAIKIVKLCCRFRVPEPVRQADIRSKIHLQNHASNGM